MSNDVIRIGLVGAGANTKLRHIPGFKAIDGVELVSVSNRSRESSQQIASEYDIPNIYDSWNELIEAPDTNAICIGTWPYMHSTLVLAALENNKHVLVEARMAMNSTEAHEMRDAAREMPRLVTQIVPAPHTLKVDGAINELIVDGYLGDILSMDLTSSIGGFADYESPFHWRQNRDLSGNNIMTLGIWYEAIMRWIGPASSVSSIARVNVKSRFDERGERKFITIPDHVEVLCEMASGPMTHMCVSSISGHAPADSIWLFGTEGTVHLDPTTSSLSGGRRGDDQLKAIDVPHEKQGNWRVEEEFINAIRGIEPVTHTNFEDGVRYMEFTDAVTQSAQSGQTVYLPLY